MYRTLCALAALAMTAGTVAFATPAQAASPDGDFTISLDGLDPAAPGDADRIERRIRNAARGLCGSQSLQPAALMQKATECEKAMVAQAQDALEAAAARQGASFRLGLRSN